MDMLGLPCRKCTVTMFQLQSLAHFSGGSRKLSMVRPTNIKFKNKVAEGSFLSWGEAGGGGEGGPGPLCWPNTLSLPHDTHLA